MDVLVIILINLIGAGLVTRIEKTRGKVDEDKKSLFMGQWPYNLILLFGTLGVLTTSAVSIFVCVVSATVIFYFLAIVKAYRVTT